MDKQYPNDTEWRHTLARNVKFSFLRGGGSSLEVLYGKVSLTPTNLHTLSSTAVLPAPTTFDLVNGTALATNVAPTPAPVGGLLPWGYKVKITDNFGKTWEYLVGVPDGTTEINFNVLPHYSESRPPAFGVGPAGPAGQSATIAIGTTTSGPTPAVTNSGTSTDAVLNFTLAKGDKGDTGAGVPTGGTALQVVRKNSGNTATEWATADKALVGLGNVDNTSDLNKPVSTATQAALDNTVSEEESRLVVKLQATDSPLRGYLNTIYLDSNSLFVDVADFGAKGDGVTDDTDAVQQALEYANNHHIETVIFPPRDTHYRMQNVSLVSNITILGFGSVIRPFTYNAFRGLSGTATGYGASVRNVRFIGIEFRGDFDAPDSSAAVTLHHADGVEFVWCRWVEAIRGGHAIDLAGCRNILVDKCIFEGFLPTTGREYAEAIQVDHSLALAVSNMDAPASYDGLPCEDIVVSRSKFVRLSRGGVTYSAPNPLGSHTTTENNHRNIVLKDCEVDGGWATGSTSSINAWVHFQGVDGLTVTGNRFSGRGVAAHVIKILTYNTGISTQDYASPSATGVLIDVKANTDITIKGNVFEGFTATSNTALITINGRADNYGLGAKIEGNRFVNNYPSDGVGNRGSASLSVSHVENLSVENNSCRRVRSLLFASNTPNVRVHGNDIEGSQWVAIAVEGVSSVGVSITGNAFNRCGSSVYVNQARGVVVGLNNYLDTLPGSAYAGYAQAPVTVAESLGVSITGNSIMPPNPLVPNGILLRSGTTKAVISGNVILGMTSPITIDGTSDAVTTSNITT